ncbi:hypothetical protein PRK78_002980 [Emydomyces testavorans]|uniref:Uncharacterized protein n=1 Tax=Emydomyces testavorans TaxID=2070801 RepID=A0AAF0DFZ3_9EURO|nr:hypothetical protein PRK78_002980 [Emydomyces testavorans]
MEDPGSQVREEAVGGEEADHNGWGGVVKKPVPSVSLSTAATVTAVPFIIAAVHPPAPPEPSSSAFHNCGSILSSSARNVKAQRRPHHAAGAMLNARHIRRGKYQRRSTPRITATRGCKGLVVTDCGEGLRAEVFGAVWEGGGGRMFGSKRLLEIGGVWRRRG